MWEAIERNKRRSWMLLALMGALLLALGYVIGAAVYVEYAGVKQLGVGYAEYHQMINRGLEGEDLGSPPRFFEWTKEPGLLLNGGGVIGLGVAALLWAILTSVAFFSGDRAILWTAGALEIQREDAPRVWNVVEEMTIAAGLAKPPRVFLIDDDGMNAFAVGLSPDHAGVAVTSGLVKRMSRDELQGVVAHEIGHIHNYDIRFMTLASIMMGSIVLISEVFLRSLRHAPRRSSSSKNGGGAQVILLVVAVLFAILAPFAAQILYFACSRKREYLADACAARFTRYPPGLASALERIGREGKATGDVKRGLAPLYTVNPLQPMSASSLFSSHPPLEKRIAILRSMGGAGYAEYERAFHEVVPTAKPCIESTVIENDSVIGIRAPQREVVAGNDIDRSREVLDVIDRAAQYLFISCACGVRLKMPPGMSRTELKCPKCGTRHEVPHAVESPMNKDTEDRGSGKESESLTYQRTTTGWESFRCTCGKTIQISPSFSAKRASCRSCGRHIRIASNA